MKKILMLLVTIVFLFGLVGCKGNNNLNNVNNETKKEETKTEDKKEKVKITVVGSTSVTPAMELIVAEYEKANENVLIDIQGIGSTAGVNATNDKTAQIGMASRNLKEKEKAYGLTEYVLAFDGIAVVIHPSNPLTALDKETITKIFNGEITNWNEIGGEDGDIIVISREEGSGTRGAFDGIMDLIEKTDAGDKYSLIVDNAIIADGNGAVKANVASKKLAIGYVSLSYLDDSIKPIQVDKVDASVENVVNSTYKISRPFLLLTKGEINKDVQEFLDFALGAKGQELMKLKWVPAN